MAVAFVNLAETVNTTAATALSVTMPTFSAGDVVIVIIAGTNSVDPSGTHSSDSSAFTLIGSLNQNITSASAIRFTAWYRVMQGGDGSTFGWTASSAQGFHAIAASYSGVDNTTPINTSGFNLNSSASTTITMPSVTTDVDGCMIVHAASQDDQEAKTGYGGTERMTWNSGTTGISAPGNGTNCALGDETQISLGATTARTCTILTEENCGFTIALNPVLVSYTLTGEVRRAGGGVETAVTDVFLVQKDAGNSMTFIDYVASTITTGVYTFTGLSVNTGLQVIAFLDGSPDQMDCTEWTLTATVE